MMRRLAGRTLLVLGTLLLLWSVWSVFDLMVAYRDSAAKGDYAGYGLSLTFYAVLLWPSTVAALLGGFVLETPRALRRLESGRVRRITGALLLGTAGLALLAFLRVSFFVVGGFFSYMRSLEDVAFGLTLFTVAGLPLLGATSLLSLAGFRLSSSPHHRSP